MIESTGDDTTSVRVVVRIRPQLAKERIDMCQICTSVTPGEPQIVLGKDKAFTYDFVHDTESNQEDIYETCAKYFVEGTFNGYNATIFAYGQTGSGKTYTMGTGFEMNSCESETGIIPHAVEHLFNGIEQRKNAALEKGDPPPDFKVNAQFMELYNEEVLDLLDTTRDPGDRNRKSHIKIHEDASGGIYTVGITTRPVTSVEDTLKCLKIGSLCRTTASTNMNTQSSRSHAIFTLHIKQHRIVTEEVTREESEQETTEMVNEFETLSAKFHFVDLAGSERLKRTGATGDRAKEGISINCGLLALGNVISALGDNMKRGSHVPYRDSKLTRLLQDSLGGNSRTVMIACISPSDRDFMETLNTLKYANRARNIKNKVTINQDKTSKQIAALRAEVASLQDELMDYRMGRRLMDTDGVESINDMFQENAMLQTENDKLRQRIKAKQETIDTLTARNAQIIADIDTENLANMSDDAAEDEVRKLIEGYNKEIEVLRTKLFESEAMMEVVNRSASRSASRTSMSPRTQQMHPLTPSDFDYNDVALSRENNIPSILEIAKRDVSKMKEKVHSKKSPSTEDGGNESDGEKQNDVNEEFENKDENITDEDEQEDVEEEEDEELSDSDSEEDSEELHCDLANLTCEISIKQKLIEELEESQKRLHMMKQRYEDKLISLESRIKETEQERDTVLSSLGKYESKSDEKSKKIRLQYEKKLNDMQSDLKKLQAAKKEHAKMLRNQSHYEKQLKSLQRDLGEMKKLKCKLMNQIKDETAKTRKAEQRRNREVSQLKKEQRNKDNQIRSLETEKRKKEIVLKRKLEEVESLRKRQQKPMSSKISGRVGKYDKPPTVPVSNVGRSRRHTKSSFSPKAAKSKWDALEKSVSSIIVKKQTVNHMENDMERWLKQRETFGKKKDKAIMKKKKALLDGKDEEIVCDLVDQVNTLDANITYVQDNINECQSNIMGMEETKDEGQEPTALIEHVTFEESKYLLEHLINYIIHKGLITAQKDSENKELLAKLHQERMDSTFQRDMLQYLIQDKVDVDIDDSILNRDDSDGDSTSTSRSSSPVDRLLENPAQPIRDVVGAIPPNMLPDLLPKMIGSDDMLTTSTSSLAGRTVKARRKTATTADLLYVGSPTDAPTSPLCQSVPETTEGITKFKISPDAPSQPQLQSPNQDATVTMSTRTESSHSRTEVSDAAPPQPRPVENSHPSHTNPSPSVTRKSYTAAGRSTVSHQPQQKPMPSPQFKRRQVSSVSSGSVSTQSPAEVINTTPPDSPTFRRQGSLRGRNNVFSRLTSNAIPASPHPSRGIISSTSSRSGKTGPLVHSHTAVGHTKAVLSLYATDELLFSSSKDRTAKIWDLHTSEEILTLDGHPNNVTCVRFSEENSLIYTVSTYFIKVWDLREGKKCIRTLMSSGLTQEGSVTVNNSTRQVTCPPGETIINDIALTSTGMGLYSASGNHVRIFDLRASKSVGRLSGGHQAAIMVLALDDTDTADGNICIVTGSKDHYIKVFELMDDSVGSLTPKYNLDPPHYDGIQSLCLMGDLLFSGSRDTCIKKWDLAEQKLKYSINNSHKDWICGLGFVPGGNCLVSGCRGGFLKLWNIDTCQQLGEINAHSSTINAIHTNSTLVFSASNDRSIRMWKLQGSLEALDDSDDE